ncbi:hypothetical protein BC832DRAFT_328065 [Gaertneriomyces semiglobifer]|nr:hypothetical protein BC832DRAFT_328065 [Gaertneriomyces semiglobifer]
MAVDNFSFGSRHHASQVPYLCLSEMLISIERLRTSRSIGHEEDVRFPWGRLLESALLPMSCMRTRAWISVCSSLKWKRKSTLSTRTTLYARPIFSQQIRRVLNRMPLETGDLKKLRFLYGLISRWTLRVSEVTVAPGEKKIWLDLAVKARRL